MSTAHGRAHANSALIAYVLWALFGLLGLHRMYLGRVGSGVVMLILLLLASCVAIIPFLGWVLAALLWFPLFVWWIVDAFLIPGMARAAASGGSNGQAA